MRRRIRPVVVAALIALTLDLFGPAPADATPHHEPTPASLVAPAQSLAAAAQYDDSIRVDGAVDYTVDLAARTVRVHIEVTLESRLAPRQVAGGIERFFYTDFPFAVPAGATNFRAVRVSSGASQPVDVTPIDDYYAIGRMRLSPRLDFGDPAAYVIDYDLVDDGQRSATATRVNAAFASFDLIPVGGPGTADVAVTLPSGLLVDVIGETLEDSVTDGGDVRRSTTDIADPATWYASVSARDDDKLLSRTVRLDDGPVVVKAWPGDDVWADFVADSVARGVPAIEAAVGLPRPDTDELTIIESASPYLYGYAGWYLPADDLIEIGDQLDRQVVLHELSHIWFNSDLYDSRWINEGLAELVSNRTLVALGEQATPPPAIDRSGPGSQALNDWADPFFDVEDNGESEQYGYDASYVVADRLFGTLDIETFHAVLEAASAHHIAYVGSGPAEVTESAPDWRALVDQLDEIAASTDPAAVFAEFVVNDAERAELARRTEARARYLALVDRAGGWVAPFELREAMAQWRFDETDALVDAAAVLLDRRDALAEVLVAIDLAVPDALRDRYDTATNTAALEAFDDFDDAAAALVDADGRIDADTGLLGRIGLLGTDPDATLDRAEASFSAGDAGAARSGAVRAVDAVDGAAGAGALRLAIAAVAAAGIAVFVRRRRNRPALVSQPETILDPVPATGEVDPAGAGLIPDPPE